MNKRQISINMLSGVISSMVALSISFFITPYLVKQVGDEAYGYIGLSSNFITIATLFTTALNSMANRFILLAYENKDYHKVNIYFSSLFAAGGILAVVFFLTGLLMAGNIEKIFHITYTLLPAVRITFILSVTNFAVISLFTVFSASVFVQNRLDLAAKSEIRANVIKALFLIGIFVFCEPRIYYMPIGGLLYTIILYLGHLKATRKLLPDVKIKLSLARFSAIKELVVSGLWNSVNSVIQLLMVGMDLALANWLLDGRAMGLISIANTITVASNSVLVVVINAFKPTIAHTYASGDYRELHNQIKISNRMQCAVLFVPIAGVCVFGKIFYHLWMPYKDAVDIQILTAVTFVKVFDQFAGLTNDSIRDVFYLYNRLKENALTKLLLSILNIPLVVLLVKMCDSYVGSILIISGLSSALYLVYYWIFIPVFASKITGERVVEYYKIIVHAVLMFVVLLLVYTFINKMIQATAWRDFVILVSIAGIIGYFITFSIALDKVDKRKLYEAARQKFRR